MNPKKKSEKMHLFFCLMQLLLDCLDELKATTPRIIELKSQIIEMIELLNEQTGDTNAVRKTTYFQEITKKIDTIIRKSFNPEM